MWAYIFHGAMRCGCGSKYRRLQCSAGPTLNDCMVRCGCGPLHCGAVRSWAKLLGPRRALAGERTPAVRWTRHRFRRCNSNLDALTSSSNEETLDVKKCEDFAVTIVCNSEEAGTRVNSEEVLSDEDFPAVFGAKDIQQVVRQRDRPPGGPTRRTARTGGHFR